MIGPTHPMGGGGGAFPAQTTPESEAHELKEHRFPSSGPDGSVSVHTPHTPSWMPKERVTSEDCIVRFPWGIPEGTEEETAPCSTLTVENATKT